MALMVSRLRGFQFMVVVHVVGVQEWCLGFEVKKMRWCDTLSLVQLIWVRILPCG